MSCSSRVQTPEHEGDTEGLNNCTAALHATLTHELKFVRCCSVTVSTSIACVGRSMIVIVDTPIETNAHAHFNSFLSHVLRGTERIG